MTALMWTPWNAQMYAVATVGTLLVAVVVASCLGIGYFLRRYSVHTRTWLVAVLAVVVLVSAQSDFAQHVNVDWCYWAPWLLECWVP